MRSFNQITAIILAAALLAPCPAPLYARTKKGDRLLAQGKSREIKKDWDAALELYEQALSEDPTDTLYRISTERIRFQAGQAHVDEGLKVRAQGLLGEALIHFQKAYAINPASAAAEQEIRRTQQMIERERQKAKETGKESSATEKSTTPTQAAKRQTEERIASMLALPELKALNQVPINLKMNNQPPKVLFETVAKVAGINLLFDPEYTPGKNLSIEFNNSTLDEALDYLAVVTKSYWKPLSANAIFVTNDNVTKRRDYEDQVMKVYYLNNVNSPQELQEIVTAVRSVADIQRLFVYNAQNAIIARGEADRIALADKIISDLDKPRSEVVVDIMVMEASSVFTRNLTAAIASTGLNVPAAFTPRSGLRVVSQPTTTGTGTGTDTGTGTGTGTNGGSTTSGSNTAIPLSNLGHLASSDYSLILPDAMLQAVLSNGATKVLQAPQLRSVDNQKATLKVGDRQPTATGSFQPGIGGVGINPLVNTQFTYIDVGVNVDLTPRVHENGEVSMHVEVEISSVNGTVNLGGIDQPIIGQRKVIHDLRMREGEVSLLGGLMKQQDTKTVTGIPGLSSIPLLRRLFTGENVQRNKSELMIALIPHIIRRPEITEQNLRGIAVGNSTVVKLNYAPRKADQPQPPKTPAHAPATPGALPATAPPPAPAPATPGALPATAPPPAPAPATPGALPATAPPPAPAPGVPPINLTAPRTPAPAAPARVTFVPSQLEINAGGAISVNVVLENAADAAGAPMQIRFDPKVLRLNDIVPGGLFSSDGQQVAFTKNIFNDNGSATVTLGRPGGVPGVSGSGSLVTLSFQAVGRGATVVSIPNLTVRNSQGATLATMSPELSVNVK
jgi:general secretion pathway protein D